jgi:hypothetical protein
MLHKMYHDLLSVGRFLKYDHIDDQFVEATKEEVMRKISQAIQYQKRTRIPEGEKGALPKSHCLGQKHGRAHKETKQPGDSSLSIIRSTGKFNQWSGHDTRQPEHHDNESQRRTKNLDLLRELLREQEVRSDTEKFGDHQGIPRANHDTSARAVLPFMASLNTNWSLKPSVHSIQAQRDGIVPPSTYNRPLDYDALVSDAIDAVLGKRQTETLPPYESIKGVFQNGGND